LAGAGHGVFDGGICGTITPSGTYTAPGAPPAPDAIQAVAVSNDDTSQSGIANVTISTGANILTLHPSSCVRRRGAGLHAARGRQRLCGIEPGAGIRNFDWRHRAITTCISALECTAPVTASDVAAAGSVSVQIQNPNAQNRMPSR